jgi:MFS family permease
VPGHWIPIFYAVAMAVSGTGSLVFGRLYDRVGFSALIGLTLLFALFAPLVFLGGFWIALLGATVWGLGMGVHESIIPAAVAPMVAVERALMHSASSPLVTASSGSLGVPSSGFSMMFRCQRRLRSASWLSLLQCRSSFVLRVAARR